MKARRRHYQRTDGNEKNPELGTQTHSTSLLQFYAYMCYITTTALYPLYGTHLMVIHNNV